MLPQPYAPEPARLHEIGAQSPALAPGLRVLPGTGVRLHPGEPREQVRQLHAGAAPGGGLFQRAQAAPAPAPGRGERGAVFLPAHPRALVGEDAPAARRPSFGRTAPQSAVKRAQALGLASQARNPRLSRRPPQQDLDAQGAGGGGHGRQIQKCPGGIDFTNPDFVALAAAYGLPGWRISRADEFAPRLAHALTLDVPSVIVVPIDYSLDVAIAAGLGDETVAT